MKPDEPMDIVIRAFFQHIEGRDSGSQARPATVVQKQTTLKFWRSKLGNSHLTVMKSWGNKGGLMDQELSKKER